MQAVLLVKGCMSSHLCHSSDIYNLAKTQINHAMLDVFLFCLANYPVKTETVVTVFKKVGQFGFPNGNTEK